MRILLDTHALFWWMVDHARLKPKALRAVNSSRNEVFASAASVWEMALKRARGKIRFPDNLAEAMERNRIQPLDIRMAHVLRASELPAHHADPFDRVIIAQAMIENLTIMTRDAQFEKYDVPILAC